MWRSTVSRLPAAVSGRDLQARAARMAWLDAFDPARAGRGSGSVRHGLAVRQRDRAQESAQECAKDSAKDCGDGQCGVNVKRIPEMAGRRVRRASRHQRVDLSWVTVHHGHKITEHVPHLLLDQDRGVSHARHGYDRHIRPAHPHRRHGVG
jgi:hypothetical protein